MDNSSSSSVDNVDHGKDDRKKRNSSSNKKNESDRKHKSSTTTLDDHRDRKRSSRRKRKRHHRHEDEDDSSTGSSSEEETNDDSDSNDSSDDRSRKKKKKRKYHDDDDDRDRHKKKKKHSKKKRDSKKKKDKKKSKKKKHHKEEVEGDNKDDGRPVFGKYGVIKLSDMPTKQRSFELWLEQVKGLPAFNGPKWELQNYFKEYAEDYNTATLPHIKYYDYDKWEMDEYNRNKQKAMADDAPASSKEALFQQEQRELSRHKQSAGFDLIKSTMNKEKIQEMKRQKQLQSEMAHAFKMGDHARYQQLKSRLEREK